MVPPSDRTEEEKILLRKVDSQPAPELTPTAPLPHPVPQSREEAAAQEPKGKQPPLTQPHPPPATTTTCNKPSSIALAPHHPTLARLKKTACLRWN